MTLRCAAAFLLLPTAAFAAPKSPVQWRIQSAPTTARAGAKITVTLLGQIDPGWHLYALEEPEGGPIATVVGLAEGDPADLLDVHESRPIVVDDSLFHLRTSFFRTTAAFTLHAKLDPSARPGTNPLHVLIRFQSCNDQVCLPPHTDTVELPLTITH